MRRDSKIHNPTNSANGNTNMATEVQTLPLDPWTLKATSWARSLATISLP